MSIGKRIRDARTSRGITQLDLARQVGCTEVSVGNWEREVVKPLGVYVEKLEAVLGVSLKEESDERQNQDPPGGGSGC